MINPANDNRQTLLSIMAACAAEAAAAGYVPLEDHDAHVVTWMEADPENMNNLLRAQGHEDPEAYRQAWRDTVSGALRNKHVLLWLG